MGEKVPVLIACVAFPFRKGLPNPAGGLLQRKCFEKRAFFVPLNQHHLPAFHRVEEFGKIGFLEDKPMRSSLNQYSQLVKSINLVIRKHAGFRGSETGSHSSR
jgi:hypothetical protein